MKKYLYSIFILFLALPIFAACPLTGVCGAPSDSIFSDSEIRNKYLPDNLSGIRKPNAFTPQYVEPYDEMRMNTGESVPQYSPSNLTPQLPDNSNCQFGLCLP